MTHLTLRIPRGLWKDLEDTVIQQDRQFLTEVARTLGLPVAEVLRKCLGSGAPQPVLWTSSAEEDKETQCPVWTLHGFLWKPCARIRLSPTKCCPLHEPIPPTARLASEIKDLPIRTPVRYEGTLYWFHKGSPLLHEDGSIVATGTLRAVDFRGSLLLAWVPSGVKDLFPT
jgi:hypothetical protein